jgi:hypothetical protein
MACRMSRLRFHSHVIRRRPLCPYDLLPIRGILEQGALWENAGPSLRGVNPMRQHDVLMKERETESRWTESSEES